MRDRQDQRAGHNSANLQAGGNMEIHYYAGSSASDVKRLINETIQENLYAMRGIAAEVLSERYDKIVKDVVERIADENPAALQKASDPDFQITMLEAAKAYGRTGDLDLEALLVDIIVDRINKPNRSLQQIVLGNAIEVAPKLTQTMIDALTVCWFVRSMTFTQVSSLDEAASNWYRSLVPFLHGVWPISEPSFLHLQSTGCGQVSIGHHFFHQLVPLNFPRIFENADRPSTLPKFDAALALLGDPILAKLPETWNNSSAKYFVPSTLGIAIAHANLRRKTGAASDLGIWIN